MLAVSLRASVVRASSGCRRGQVVVFAVVLSALPIPHSAFRSGAQPYVTSSQDRKTPFRVCLRETRCARSGPGERGDCSFTTKNTKPTKPTIHHGSTRIGLTMDNGPWTSQKDQPQSHKEKPRRSSPCLRVLRGKCSSQSLSAANCLHPCVSVFSRRECLRVSPNYLSSVIPFDLNRPLSKAVGGGQ